MRRVRLALLWSSATLTLIVLAWASAVLYVQSAAARDVEKFRRAYQAGLGSPSSFPDVDEFKRVRDQGCRALPALVAELDPAADPVYNHAISNLIRIAVAPAFWRESDGAWTKAWSDMDVLWYEQAMAPTERAKRIKGLRSWWRAEGHAFHQSWRFWSTQCAPHAR